MRNNKPLHADVNIHSFTSYMTAKRSVEHNNEE